MLYEYISITQPITDSLEFALTTPESMLATTGQLAFKELPNTELQEMTEVAATISGYCTGEDFVTLRTYAQSELAQIQRELGFPIELAGYFLNSIIPLEDLFQANIALANTGTDVFEGRFGRNNLYNIEAIKITSGANSLSYEVRNHKRQLTFTVYDSRFLILTLRQPISSSEEFEVILFVNMENGQPDKRITRKGRNLPGFLQSDFEPG